MIELILIDDVLINLEFCDKCNSVMNITSKGYVCPKCGYEKLSDLDTIIIRRPDKKPEPIYSGIGQEDALIVKRVCPNCKNPEAFQTVTVIIGDPEGVNTERSITRYKCTKCYHVWIEY